MALKSLSRLFLCAAVFGIVLSGAACSHAQTRWQREGGWAQSRAAQRSESGGSKKAMFEGRPYNLYVPSGKSAVGKMPLLIVLHGAFGNADFIENALGMDPVAEKYGMMVAYLNGTAGEKMPRKKFWNIGNGCCGPAGEQNVDDVGYISDFISHMKKTHNIDPSSVFLMGHSNGSMMSYTYACAVGGVGGIVTVSGPLPSNQCSQGKDLRVLHVHGTADEHVPFDGGRGKKTLTSGTTFRSVSETERIMERDGASFTLKKLPGTGHDMESIRGAIDLPEMAARFLLQK